MKLLYITNGTSAPGGLERVLSIKASYFADHMGYDVHIITLNDGGREQFYSFSPRITFHDIQCGGNPLQYFNQYSGGLRRIVKSIAPDIISVCDDGLKGFFVPLFLGGKPSPMIYERHVSRLIALGGREPNFKDRVQFKLMNYGARLYDRMVVLTKDNLSEWDGLDNLAVISNPLSFYPDSVSTLDNKRIIAVGKLGIQKGYERLLEAWKIIEKRAIGWSVHIYGAENDGGKLRSMVSESSLSESFILHPPTQAIEQEYLSSSIYAFPSRFEGFGMVLIEAMACGVPCVSFDCPCGPRDIIRDGEDGFLVENGDVQTLADRLLQLIEDEELRREMGAKARVNVKRYGIESIAQQWSGLFNEIRK
ncbi:MAG: glycosyltransferase family 4 protein [Bacteroidales bacterium]